ncbi:AgmX/PglI C-terminal domain-containing protein [Colwellia sp. E2M01]|uniref:AgmX/PglI C-terminal domain-containing protein n=1 Tax=Colwellia sp. E2M01 TaxID=2841561 RepID=UPI001C09EDE9|nr:AgmX/PglI C-terminal domain-containing protein [Colwellia sp. E2M01]MBU2870777.1 AgmX/PglI C-terminal domain-containing protein [Colwellia sp. E2M01]
MTKNNLASNALLSKSADINIFQDTEQDKKFTRILQILIGLYLVIAVIVPLIEQAEVPREIKEKVPVQLAKIMLQEKKLPVPEKPKEIPKEEKPEEVKDEPEKKPEPPKTKRQEAKQKAQTSGLAAMKDELFAMRDAFEVQPATTTKLNKSSATETKVQRKLLASAADTQSTQLAAANTTQTVASDELSTRDTQQVRLSAEEVLASTDTAEAESIAAKKSGQRSELVLRRTLEANKSRLYSRYNRALRKDPFLKGKVLFEIEILPSGKVSKVTIKSSELNNPALERQLVIILRAIEFTAEQVGTVTTIWSIDFLPS